MGGGVGKREVGERIGGGEDWGRIGGGEEWELVLVVNKTENHLVTMTTAGVPTSITGINMPSPPPPACYRSPRYLRRQCHCC